MTAETNGGRTIKDVMKGFDGASYRGRRITDLHALRGTHQGPVFDKHGKEYQLGQDERGVWENVVEHTGEATFITDVLAEAMGLKRRERVALNMAAWLHDSGKKTERMWQLAIEGANLEGDEGLLADDTATIFDAAYNARLTGVRKGQVVPFDAAVESSTQAFKADAKVKALDDVTAMEEEENALAGIPPAVSKLMKANIPESENGHDSLAAKIMWFADACLTGTDIKPIGQRFDDLETDERNGARNKEFSDGFRPKYNGLSLYEVQRQLGERYAAEFAERIGIQPDQIYDWIRTKVQERIDTGTMPLMKAA